MGRQRRKRTENNSDVSGKKRKRRCKERGRTVLDLVTKALKEKKPIELEWDKVHRLPTGTFAGKFSSWIGVTARRHVSCIVETWDDVDNVLRKEILDSITGAFTVIKDRHDWCLIKAGKLWRKWKCTLVRKWLYDETGAIRRTPPELYDHITPEEWNAFLASHTTEEFKEISAINKRNASMNNTRFYGSRAGYRGIEVIVKKDFASKGHVLEKVDRHLTWLRGHTPTNGDMIEYDKEVALKIKAVEKEVAAGTFKPEGREDILAKAIGRPEHGGRVRGVPDGISITEYFGRASKKPTTEVERLKETVIYYVYIE
ncbi:uncharacterized protein LOC141586290 [Silene latifolia]|uniref:uncharacterized protein LOC141586290 n=1 Tax=Silene latifolia TaxID=37657 RepID=UPI003D786BBD